MKIGIRLAVLLLCTVISLTVQGQSAHWNYDAYAYQYDMTAYLSVSIKGKLQPLDGCEIAAFCGDECRGVAEIQTIEKNGEQASYAYIRIRSNTSSGENIKFKVFFTSMNREFEPADFSITFKSQQVVGLPSNPVVLDLNIDFLPGDANGDWRVSIADAVAVVDYILCDGKTPLVVPAADMNADGKISISDAVAIVDYILNL